MRLTAILKAGARATVKVQKPPGTKPRARASKPKTKSADIAVLDSSSTASSFCFDDLEAEDADLSSDFSGRVHSESYSAQNLSAAFESILKTKVPHLDTPSLSPSEHEQSAHSSAFLAAIHKSTLSTMDSYRTSILTSLALDDPHGRIYSKNVRQMKDILAFEKWRKKLDSNGSRTSRKLKLDRHPISRAPLSSGSLVVRKAIFDRPSVADEALAAAMVKNLWKLDRLVDATVVLAYSGELSVARRSFG